MMPTMHSFWLPVRTRAIHYHWVFTTRWGRPVFNYLLTRWWRLCVRFGPQAVIGEDAWLTVVLLSYKRPQNIKPIVRAALKCKFVSKVVVQNNNPDIDIRPWVRVDDHRLAIYNSPSRQGAGARWEVALSHWSQYYLAIDDDVFLFPRQIARLFEQLIADPSVPHGVSGVRGTMPIHRQESTVDVLHQLYFATREHVWRFHGLLEALKPEDYAVAQHYGDDVVISHCGASRPRTHNVGLIPLCPTSFAKDVALHQLDEFPRGRLRLQQALRDVEARQ